MVRRVDPLNDKVPIVDAEGRPTGEFMLKWQQQKVANDGIPSTAAELSTLLDKFGGTQGAILLRGASEWAELPSPGGTTQFLRADGTYATPPSGAVTSVFGRTGAVVAAANDYNADQIDDAATTNKFTTAGDITKLAGIETGATADQTGAEIKTAYEAEANTNAYTDAEKTKLAGIETGAEVNDVDSVFGRTGTVVAAASDYDADQVDYDNTTSGLAATDVQAAIDEVAAAGDAPERLPTLSNNTTDATNDIDFTSGSAWDSTDTVKMTCPAMTKRLDAGWASGTGSGGRNSGAAIADTMYRWYVVAKAGGADVDYYAHTSDTVATVLTALQAETGGADYIYARRIGNIDRDSGAIRPFQQKGDRFTFKTTINDYGAAVGNSRSLVTITAPPNTIALIRAAFYHDTQTNVLLVMQPTYETDTGPTGTNIPPGASFVNQVLSVNVAGEFEIELDGNSQFAVRSNQASTNFRLVTRGWIDTRGRY